MKYNYNFFCLVFVPLCPKSTLYPRTKVVPENTFSLLLAKHDLLYLRLNTLIHLQHKNGNHKNKNLYSHSLPQHAFQILQNLTRFKIWKKVEQTLPLTHSVLPEQNWGDERDHRSHLHKWKEIQLFSLVRRHRSGHPSGPSLPWSESWLQQSFPPPSLFIPTFPFCCHWHTHRAMPRTGFREEIQLKISLGGGETGTIRVNRSSLD